MEQLQLYLWTESFPLVYVLAFVAMIEMAVIVFIITNRIGNDLVQRWVINPLLLPIFFFLALAVSKTKIGCTLLLLAIIATTITLFVASKKLAKEGDSQH